MRQFTKCLTVLAVVWLAGCASRPASLTWDLPHQAAGSEAANISHSMQPESASGQTKKEGWTTRRFAVAAANPMATDAGHQILKAGGSAVDAAIAVQMVLTLVEPQSSGIGGGTFLMHWNGRAVQAFDGRETAPARVNEKLFLQADGKPMAFLDGVVGGRSVGTPGTLRVLKMAHKQYGKLPWAALFKPAIQLAEQGFPVSPRLNALLKDDAHLRKDPTALAYFYKADGTPQDVGTVLRNPELAAVLRVVANRGPDAFYKGAVARDIVSKVRGHATNPGQLSERDLAAYRAKKRNALCSNWREFRLCGFPPPSSGTLAIMQILTLLDHVHAPTSPAGAAPLAGGLPSVDTLHAYTEASRLAFADRNLYVADPDFVSAPGGSWRSLLDAAYLRQRAALIGPQSMKLGLPGAPAGTKIALAPMPEQIEYGTSHISVIDARGHAVSMTTTIEDQFGSRQMVRGFLLNNQLSDFSFAPQDASGRPIANRVQPGKRPRSSMSPMLVFNKASGKLVMSVGSPGGAMIIHYTAKTLLGTLAWGLNAQQAINLPNFGSTNGPTLLEAGRFPAATVDALKKRGHEVRELPMTSGLQAIQGTQTGLFGAADPRREGTVAGE